MLCVQVWWFVGRRGFGAKEFGSGLDGVRGWMAFGSATHSNSSDIAADSAEYLSAAYGPHGESIEQNAPWNTPY